MLLSQIESKLHWLQGRAEGIIHFLKFYIKMAFPRFFFFEALFKCHFDNTLCNVNKKSVQRILHVFWHYVSLCIFCYNSFWIEVILPLLFQKKNSTIVPIYFVISVEYIRHMYVHCTVDVIYTPIFLFFCEIFC